MTLAILCMTLGGVVGIAAVLGWVLALRWQVRFYQTERHLREACAIANMHLSAMQSAAVLTNIRDSELDKDLARIRELSPIYKVKLE